uniref:PRO1748 n=1 Tax=Homo sapiens TaxID=9606 RepID=Q9UHU0_HUMAN|nr:PRO1748 [Homo sapiens]
MISFLHNSENPTFKHMITLNKYFIKRKIKDLKGKKLDCSSSGTVEALMRINDHAEVSS